MQHLHSISKTNFVDILLPHLAKDGYQPTPRMEITLIQGEILVSGLHGLTVPAGGVIEDSIILDGDEILEILRPYLKDLGLNTSSMRVAMGGERLLLVGLRPFSSEPLDPAYFDVTMDPSQLRTLFPSFSAARELSPEDPTLVRFGLWSSNREPLDVREGDRTLRLVATHRVGDETQAHCLATGDFDTMALALTRLQRHGWDPTRGMWDDTTGKWCAWSDTPRG